jgi:hypothetical protein
MIERYNKLILLYIQQKHKIFQYISREKNVWNDSFKRYFGKVNSYITTNFDY